MNINWYPGHMKKTKELLKENIKLVDLVIEVVDARIPESSKNPEFDILFNNKKRLIVLNKADLSDKTLNEQWIKHYKSKGYNAILYNSLNNKEIKKLEKAIGIVTRDIINKYKEKGLKRKTVKAMIVGIPNAGKSTLINSIARKKSAKTGNKPGVTRGKQWIRLQGNIDLLDTPGILWPKITTEESALNLAFTGAIKDEVINLEEIAIELIKKINTLDNKALKNRYNIDISKGAYEIICDIAKQRGCIVSGGEIDLLRISKMIIDDYRKGKLGNFTLEKI